MKRTRGLLLISGSLAIVLLPLLLLDGLRRTTGFRLAAVLLAVVALRTIAAFSGDAPAPPADSPFARPRRTPTRRRRLPPVRTPLDALVIGATERSGQFHHRLRPVLREVADERLKAGHGLTIDDPAAERILGPVAWDHLRPDRPAPEDRRSPGIDDATLRTIFDAVEAL